MAMKSFSAVSGAGAPSTDDGQELIDSNTAITVDVRAAVTATPVGNDGKEVIDSDAAIAVHISCAVRAEYLDLQVS